MSLDLFDRRDKAPVSGLDDTDPAQFVVSVPKCEDRVTRTHGRKRKRDRTQHRQCSPTDQKVFTWPLPRVISDKAWAMSSIQIASRSGFVGSKCLPVYVVM